MRVFVLDMPATHIQRKDVQTSERGRLPRKRSLTDLVEFDVGTGRTKCSRVQFQGTDVSALLLCTFHYDNSFKFQSHVGSRKYESSNTISNKTSNRRSHSTVDAVGQKVGDISVTLIRMLSSDLLWNRCTSAQVCPLALEGIFFEGAGLFPFVLLVSSADVTIATQ